MDCTVIIKSVPPMFKHTCAVDACLLVLVCVSTSKNTLHISRYYDVWYDQYIDELAYETTPKEN